MTVNNIAHVHECIVSLPEELGFSELTQDQESENTGGPLQSTSSAGDSFEVCDVECDLNSSQGEKLPQWALSANTSRRNTEVVKEEEQPQTRITCSDETSNEYLQGLVDSALSDMKSIIFKLLEIVPKRVRLKNLRDTMYKDPLRSLVWANVCGLFHLEMQRNDNTLTFFFKIKSVFFFVVFQWNEKTYVSFGMLARQFTNL